ncbi:MAG: hypothetical protein GDA49_12570 [Rhodospirillales bacterium]|nr:hypothetical protein [Rhodospirillales bacterium]
MTARLPTRRPGITERVMVPLPLSAEPVPIYATLNFDPRTGRACECFARSGKPNSDRDGMLDDAAVLISLALRAGARLTDLQRHMARDPGDDLTPGTAAAPIAPPADPALRGHPTSLIGGLLDALVTLESAVRTDTGAP